MSKLPGTKAGRSYRRPVCSAGHKRPPVKDRQGQWVCPECFNEWAARETGDRTVGGVYLPREARGTDQDFFSTRFPNRRMRRA